MPGVVSPEDMTPGERLAEVAAILARGVIRQFLRGVLAVSESLQIGLGSGRETSPHVRSPVDGHRDSESEGG
jgi:hypothetical protein